MSKTWFIIFFCLSIFNLPLVGVGDNFVGIFDIVLFLLFLYVVLTRTNYNIPPKFIYIQFSIVGLLIFSTIINHFEVAIDWGVFLYLVKLLSYSIIPILVIEAFVFFNFNERDFEIIDNYLLFIGHSLLFYSIYEAFAIYGMTRSGVPFSYGSSGPLGLVGLGFCIYFFIFQFSKNRIYFLIIGVALLVAAFSKSFILAFLFILIYRLRDVFNLKIFIVLLWLFFAASLYVFEDLLFLYNSLDDIANLTTFSERLDNHWFEYWDLLFDGYNFVFGLGKQNIDIAIDSTYFFLLYGVGVFGVILLSIIFLWLSCVDLMSRIYIIALLTSGMFLETMIISPRGMEPFMILYSYYFVRLKSKSIKPDMK
jgi:hypothetical protein